MGNGSGSIIQNFSYFLSVSIWWKALLEFGAACPSDSSATTELHCENIFNYSTLSQKITFSHGGILGIEMPGNGLWTKICFQKLLTGQIWIMNIVIEGDGKQLLKDKT